MAKFYNREQITGAVLKTINSEYTDQDFDQAMMVWWQNFRRTGGYGLTFTGNKAFEFAEIAGVEFVVGDSGYQSQLLSSLELDRKMIVPYHLFVASKKQIIKVYDDRIILLIGLYGSIREYLDSIGPRINIQSRTLS